MKNLDGDRSFSSVLRFINENCVNKFDADKMCKLNEVISLKDDKLLKVLKPIAEAKLSEHADKFIEEIDKLHISDNKTATELDEILEKLKLMNNEINDTLKDVIEACDVKECFELDEIKKIYK